MFWYFAMTGNFLGVRMVDIFGPLEKILVTSLAQSREQRKLQMVMGVDQAWKDQITFQINRRFPRRIGPAHCAGEDRLHTRLPDVELSFNASGRHKRKTSTP